MYQYLNVSKFVIVTISLPTLPTLPTLTDKLCAFFKWEELYNEKIIYQATRKVRVVYPNCLFLQNRTNFFGCLIVSCQTVALSY